MKTYYFISGLPRTGSTLLSSILNQNPKFDSGPASPVLNIIKNLEKNFVSNEMFLAYPKPQQASNIMRSVLHEYHSDSKKQIVFDKCRQWSDNVPIIKNYFGIENPKIIATVRNIDYILSSFLRVIKRNSYDVNDLRLNFIDKWLVTCNLALNDENRCDVLMDKNGVIGESIISLSEGLSKYRKNILLVDYDKLVVNPTKTLKVIYDFLEEEYYEYHDLKNIQNNNKVDDIFTYGLSGMHDVRKELKFMSPNPKEVIPKSIYSKINNMRPWEIDSINFS